MDLEIHIPAALWHRRSLWLWLIRNNSFGCQE
jgi:hypothetical protein